MAYKIPNLWNEDPAMIPYYRIFLSHLQMAGKHDRIVAACRQIRRYAERGARLDDALFTFHEEIGALCDLKKYKTAWRVLQARDDMLYGPQADVANHPERANPYELEPLYAPLLFYLKRYQTGCAVKEAALDPWFRRGKMQSYNVLFAVYNGEREPTHRFRVTLAHFYERLGRDLAEWQHWTAFVNGFHPKLFRMAGVGREDLLHDAAQISPFFEKLLAIRNERLTSGIGGSVSDLLDSPAKVKQRQARRQQAVKAFDRRIAGTRREVEKKLADLFPELRELS